MNIQKMIVTTALVVTAAAAAAAGSALADTLYPVAAPFVSTKTRAEVVAELTQAGDQARVNYSNSASAYPVLQAAASTKTRAEVRAELAAADQELGGIRHISGN
jgi:phage terminase large subunit-like protein